jgi:FlaA1/EpsC-like NDP-sugar epimerase
MAKKVNVLIVGAGEAGRMSVREMLAHPEYGYVPVGFVDDDVSKHGLEIGDLKVLGSRDRIKDLVTERDVDVILIAMPSASGDTIRSVVRVCEQARVDFKVVPGIREIIAGDVKIDQIRTFQPEDLLGRETVSIDDSHVRGYLKGKRVMVTGAGGSIGAELCRQAASYGPESIALVGRGENSIFEIELDLKTAGVQGAFTPVIADVRDRSRVAELMSRFKPHAVFHAAAHKHVYLMEMFPDEAVLNNVMATMNVVEEAIEGGVERVVMLSTDKAVWPRGVMGATKRVAELYLRMRSAESPGTALISVRFGNVLGTRGSVVPIFLKQIARGGPVTVSDPNATRYFMTVKEATMLVIQAGVLGAGGETFILDMGQAVRIIELARDLITLSGYTPQAEVPIVITGLKPGEKTEERLTAPGEELARTRFEKLMVARTETPPGAGIRDGIERLIEHARRKDRAEVIRTLVELVPEYKPAEEGWWAR